MFNVAKEDMNFLICHCPHHEDKDPSLYINKVENKGKPIGFYYCYSCGIHGVLTEKEVEAMSRKPKSKRNRVANIDWYKLWLDTVTNLKHLDWEQADALADSWKVSPVWLQKFGMGWLEDWYSFPFYDGYYNVIGLQLRTLDGQKMSVEGSKLGLFLHSNRPYKNIIICEGVSDSCISLNHGFYTIGKPNCLVGNKLVLTFIKNTGYKGSIIICSDNDVAGKQGAEELKKTLKNYNSKIVIPEPYNDLKEFYLNGGNVKELLK